MAEHQRLPLSIRVSSHEGGKDGGRHVDGIKTVLPGDPEYNESFRLAVREKERFGIPIPYARGVNMRESVFSYALEHDTPAAQAAAILRTYDTPWESILHLRKDKLVESISPEVQRQLALRGYVLREAQ